MPSININTVESIFNTIDLDPEGFQNVVLDSFDENTAAFLFDSFRINVQGTDFDISEENGKVKIDGGTVSTINISQNGLIGQWSSLDFTLDEIAKLILKEKIDKLLAKISAGNDLMGGNNFENALGSGAGDDEIIPRLGDDVVDGGKGIDTAWIVGNFEDFTIDTDGKAVTVIDTNEEDQDQGTDMLVNVELLLFDDLLFDVRTSQTYEAGTFDDDDLTGTNNDDILFGKSGNDEILGLGGSDVLKGGFDNDTLVGNTELMVGVAIVDPDKDELYGGSGDDTYVIGKGDRVYEEKDAGEDLIIASQKIKLGDNIENAVLWVTGSSIRGNDLGNILVGNDEDNKIDGRDGDDTIDGAGGDDRLSGGDGADQIDGGDGNDRISGGAGIDDLNGGAGDDQIDGGDSTDMLTGGAGVDELRGGQGLDTFIFEAVDANDVDVISDFGDGGDRIDLQALAIGDLDGFLDGAVADGKDVIFTAENGARLIIEKTSLDDLGANDFIFA